MTKDIVKLRKYVKKFRKFLILPLIIFISLAIIDIRFLSAMGILIFIHFLVLLYYIIKYNLHVVTIKRMAIFGPFNVVKASDYKLSVVIDLLIRLIGSVALISLIFIK